VEACVAGSGIYLPERIVSNEEIAEALGLDPDYIFKSAGIRRRRWASSTETTSSLAVAALGRALKDARLAPADVDYLLFGTMTPDRFIPGTAAAVQRKNGLRDIPCLDIRATCCNALYGLQIARALIATKVARNVAICLAEIQSPWLEMSPESGKISMLFGDGASALIVSAARGEASLEILDILLATDGNYMDDLGIRSPGTEFGRPGKAADSLPRMVGQSVILQASRKVVTACEAILQRNHIAVEEVRWVVPHEGNSNLLARVMRNLSVSAEKTTAISVMEDLGNTSSASMGIAIDKLRRAHETKSGDYVLLPAFGAGFTWGAGLCRVS